MFLLKAFGRQSKRHLRAGFTLIELLVVVLIIGILAAVALPQYNRAVLRARFSEVQILTRNFADASARYYLANGQVPDYWKDLDIQPPGGCSAPDTQTQGPMICRHNIVCDLLGADEENIVCKLSDASGKMKASYVQWFGPGNSARQCWAAKGDADAQGLCKGMGGAQSGKTTSHAYCNEVGGCEVYDLP